MEEPMECETVLNGFPKHSALLETSVEPQFFHSPIPCDPCVSVNSALSCSGGQWTSSLRSVQPRKRPAADMMFPHPVPPLVGRQAGGWMPGDGFYSPQIHANPKPGDYSTNSQRRSDPQPNSGPPQPSGAQNQHSSPSTLNNSPPAAAQNPQVSNGFPNSVPNASNSPPGAQNASTSPPYQFQSAQSSMSSPIYSNLPIDVKPHLPSILISQPGDLFSQPNDFKPFAQQLAASNSLPSQQNPSNSPQISMISQQNPANSFSGPTMASNSMLNQSTGSNSVPGTSVGIFNGFGGFPQSSISTPTSNPMPNSSAPVADFSSAFSNSFPPSNLIPNSNPMSFGVPISSTMSPVGSFSPNPNPNPNGIPTSGFGVVSQPTHGPTGQFPANPSTSHADSTVFRVPAVPRRRPPQRSRSATHLPLPTRVLIHDAAAESPTGGSASAYRMFTWPIEEFQRRSAAGQPTLHSAQFFATADQRIPFTLSMDPNYGNGRIRFTGRFVSVPTFEQRRLIAELAIWMQDERGNALREEKMRCVVVNEFISTVAVTLTADRRFLIDPQQNLLPNGTLMIWAQTHVRPVL